MVKVSTVIITHNEEHNIARCIESVKGISDEIVLVDSFSDDKTASIAQSYGAKVFFRAFRDFVDQKSFAIECAKNEWVLSVDADEVLSPELQASIQKEKENPAYDAYNVNILANYCG